MALFCFDFTLLAAWPCVMRGLWGLTNVILIKKMILDNYIFNTGRFYYFCCIYLELVLVVWVCLGLKPSKINITLFSHIFKFVLRFCARCYKLRCDTTTSCVTCASCGLWGLTTQFFTFQDLESLRFLLWGCIVHRHRSSSVYYLRRVCCG